MPQSVTSSRPNSAPPAARSSHRPVRVVLLDKQELIVHVENKSARVLEVFQQVCQHVTLKETDYFGLAIKRDGEFHFIANDTKLHKLAPKVWKAKDCPVDEPLLTFHFRVQYYVDNIGLLKERATRLQYYLQLRDNLLHYSQSVTEEKCFLLAGLALQADFGNFNVDKHVGQYFDAREFFPAWVMMRRGQDYITHHLPTIHRDMSNINRAEARVQYIRELSTPPAVHNMHFYRLRRRKYDPPPGNEWLAICPKGIEVYEEKDDFKALLSTFLWPDISKLSCEKKKFEIVATGFAERRFIYYASSKESGEHLIDMCRATHKFQLERQAVLSELRRLEEQDRLGSRTNEMYVCSELGDVPGERDRSRASSTPVRGGSTRQSFLVEHYLQSGARGTSTPPSVTGFCSSTPVGGGETRPMEIMINSPPLDDENAYQSSLTIVSPVTGHSSQWTTPSYNVSSAFDSHAARSSVERSDAHFTQPSSLQAVTPLHSSNVGRGSIMRSSTSSNESALRSSGRGIRGAPLSVRHSPLVLGEELPVTSVVTTPINAASLQRAAPQGTPLNDVMADLWKGKKIAVRSVPPRKSSLVYPHGPSPALESSVMRSTSLRQPTKLEISESPRLVPAMAHTDLSKTPVAVGAHLQRMQFSPLTVTSNPVHGAGTAIQPQIGNVPGRQTPPSYYRPPAYYQGKPMELVSQLPNHSSPHSQLQYEVTVPSSDDFASHSVSQFPASRQYFDNPTDDESTVDDILGESSSRCRLLPLSYQYPRMPPLSDEASGSSITPTVKQVPPPSYEMAQSFKMASVMATPPSGRHILPEAGISLQQERFTNHNIAEAPVSSGVAVRPVPMIVNNGDISTQLPVSAPQLMLYNGGGHQELVANGRVPSVQKKGSPLMNGFANTPLSLPVCTPLPRQASSNSSDSAELDAQCPQHGSGLDIVQMIKTNIDTQPVPMLKALCNDRSLLTGCTCRHAPLPDSNGLEPARRMSLGQPPWAMSNQPGTIVRPYSWGSEQVGHLLRLQMADIDFDDSGLSARTASNGYLNVEPKLANGSASRSRPLIHRHSDGASFQHVLRAYTVQNHSDSLASPNTNLAVA